MRHFHEGLSVEDNAVDAEGVIPYEGLARACLARGRMPARLWAWKTLSLGRAWAGG